MSLTVVTAGGKRLDKRREDIMKLVTMLNELAMADELSSLIVVYECKSGDCDVMRVAAGIDSVFDVIGRLELVKHAYVTELADESE